MGEAKHTKGPWRVVDGSLIFSDGSHVATVHAASYSGISEEQRQANASAIAALPDLLAWQEEVTTVLLQADTLLLQMTPTSAVSHVRAAIDKALDSTSS